MRVFFAVVVLAVAGCSAPSGTSDGGADAGTPADYALWGWVTGAGGLYGSTDGTSWARVSDKPTRAAGATTLGNAVVVVSKNGAVLRTEDDGKSWTESTITGLPSSGVWSFAASDTDLFVGAQGLVFRSADRGTTWTNSGTGLPSSSQMESMTLSGSTLLVAASLSGLYRSTDNGATFTAAVSGISPSVFNNAVAAGLSTWNGKVYAAFQGTGVFVSSDAGLTWTQASAGLPATGVSRIWAAGSRLFAGPPTAGLWVTTDGATWAQTCGLPAQESVLQLSAAGDSLFLVTTNDNKFGFFISRDNGASCGAGTQPKDSSGLDDPLAAVFVR